MLPPPGVPKVALGAAETGGKVEPVVQPVKLNRKPMVTTMVL
jgi:hypothetical protein